MEEVGSSNPVFLIIHKKAAIRSYLCSAFQKRSFLPLKQQKTMKNALFFMVFCLAAFSSAIMAAPDRACPCGAKLSAPLRARTSARERVRGSHKKERFAAPRTFLFPAPNRACPCGAKFGGRGCRHRPPHRTSVLPNCQGQPQKKNRFSGSFFVAAAFQPNPNFQFLPLTPFSPREFH